jgi:uncharacterized protein YecE (DUF72 family)
MKANNIFIGTCSWKYDEWQGIVYTSKDKKNYLAEYAQLFNTVEIDQWFWSLFPNQVVLPKPETVKEYAESVPKDFRFTIKIPNSITLTHFYSNNKKELISNSNFLNLELTNRFLEIIYPMYENLGVLIFQFEYLNKQKMENQSKFNNLLIEFIEKLPKEFNYGIEIRNPNYLNQSYFEIIGKLNVTPVLVHGYYMPKVYDTYNKFEKYFNKTIVFRIHGEDRGEIEKITNNKWDKIVINRDQEIINIVEIVKQINKKQVDIYLNINNHFEGCAPLTIKKIKHLI